MAGGTPDDDDVDAAPEDVDDGDVDPKAAKKAAKQAGKRPKSLGIATVARPCLIGAGALALIGTLLPH